VDVVLQSRTPKHGTGRIHPKTAARHDRIAFLLLIHIIFGGITKCSRIVYRPQGNRVNAVCPPLYFSIAIMHAWGTLFSLTPCGQGHLSAARSPATEPSSNLGRGRDVRGHCLVWKKKRALLRRFLPFVYGTHPRKTIWAICVPPWTQSSFSTFFRLGRYAHRIARRIGRHQRQDPVPRQAARPSCIPSRPSPHASV